MAPKSLLLYLLLSLFLSDLVHTLWWSLGNRAIMDHSRICRRKGRLLAKDPQSNICRKEPMFQLILEGAKVAMKECQFQFSHHRWNCSDNRRSLKKILTRDTPETAFLNAIVSAGVTHELTAACSRGDLLECSCSRNSLGAVTLGKRKKKPNNEKRRKKNEMSKRRKERRQGGKKRRRKGGRRPSETARQNKRRRLEAREERQWTTNSLDYDLVGREDAVTPGSSPSTNEVAGGVNMIPGGGEMVPGMPGVPGGEWHWRGCDDNVGFGYRIARDFMDWRYLRRRESQDIRSIVMLRNNEAGRRAVKNHLVTHCKCHGLSGSCTHRTCWRRMPSFRNVGRHLKDRFNAAIKVIPSNDGETVMPEMDTVRPPRKQDLVFLEDSPNFCSANKRTGSLGTHRRECNSTSYDLAGCELLCCGRGYTQEEHWVEENCRCRFTYCCEVTCHKCHIKKVTSYCR